MLLICEVLPNIDFFPVIIVFVVYSMRLYWRIRIRTREDAHAAGYSERTTTLLKFMSLLPIICFLDYLFHAPSISVAPTAESISPIIRCPFIIFIPRLAWHTIYEPLGNSSSQHQLRTSTRHAVRTSCEDSFLLFFCPAAHLQINAIIDLL